MSLSFIRGMVAAVNPCGFILLPTYLMYFLGLQGAMPGTQRATMRRAVIVSGAVSAGFLSVFLVAGVISYNFTNWINENAKYATGAIGVALLVLGVAMVAGYKLPFMTPRLDAGGSGVLFHEAVGHALEAVTRYRIGHGRAVAIGMVVESRLAADSAAAEALLHGLLWMALVPPWQTPDEPKHYEFVRLMAARGSARPVAWCSPGTSRRACRSIARSCR